MMHETMSLKYNVLFVYSYFPCQITQLYSAITCQLRHRTFHFEALVANSALYEPVASYSLLHALFLGLAWYYKALYA